MYDAETSEEHDAFVAYDSYKSVLDFIGEPKLYWVSGIFQDNAAEKPWLCAISEGELTLDRAYMVLDFMKKNHKVLSAWIDTFDENNVKETVFHECYIDSFGYVAKR